MILYTFELNGKQTFSHYSMRHHSHQYTIVKKVGVSYKPDSVKAE